MTILCDYVSGQVVLRRVFLRGEMGYYLVLMTGGMGGLLLVAVGFLLGMQVGF